jgi:hypothetical protein
MIWRVFCVCSSFRVLFLWRDWGDIVEHAGHFCPVKLPAQVVTYGHRCFRQRLPEALGYFLCRHRGQEVSRTAHLINNSEAVHKQRPADESTVKRGHIASGMWRPAVWLHTFWRNLSVSSVKKSEEPSSLAGGYWSFRGTQCFHLLTYLLSWVLVGSTEGKRIRGRLRIRWKDNVTCISGLIRGSDW